MWRTPRVGEFFGWRNVLIAVKKARQNGAVAADVSDDRILPCTTKIFEHCVPFSHPRCLLLQCKVPTLGLEGPSSRVPIGQRVAAFRGITNSRVIMEQGLR